MIENVQYSFFLKLKLVLNLKKYSKGFYTIDW